MSIHFELIREMKDVFVPAPVTVHCSLFRLWYRQRWYRQRDQISAAKWLMQQSATSMSKITKQTQT